MQPIINTMLDPIVNFGKVTVSTGYNDTDTSIVLNSGHGSKLPNPSTDGSFNLVWFDSSTYASASDDPNVEIVRCIARIEDELTIMRAQEDTSASNKNTPTKTYKMILSPTKKTITDIKTEYQSGVSTHAALTTGVHGVGGSTVESTSGSASKVSTHATITSSVHGFDSLGDAPAQTHGISRHSGNIGTEANITFAATGGHAHTGTDSTKVDHVNLDNKGTSTHADIDTALTASAGHIAASGTSVHSLGTMSIQSAGNVTITGGSVTGITDLAVADGGTGASVASTTLSNLGGVPSTRTVNGKALSSDVTLSLASADFINQGTTTTVLHGNAAGSPSFGAVVTNDITNANVTYTKIQNVSATDKLLGRATAGAGVVEEIACTAAGRELLNDASATAQRTTLGLGTMATQNANSVAITGGSITGVSGVSGTDSSKRFAWIRQNPYIYLDNTGTSIFHANDTLVHWRPYPSAWVYTKFKETRLNLIPDTSLKITFTLANSTYSGRSAWGKIYRNGSPVGTERIAGGSTAFIETIAGWASGDLLQVYGYAELNTDYCDISNLRILCAFSPDNIEIVS